MIGLPLAFRLPVRPRRAPRPDPRRRRARRALLWGAAAIVLAHLGLAAAVETVLPQLRDPEYGYRLVRVRALRHAHPDRPLVVVLGTSRTQYAVDPSAMNGAGESGAPLVFNFGMSGARPAHLRLYLRRLRADGVKPAAVAVELLPATLAVSGPADALFADDVTKLSAGDVRRLAPYLDDQAAFRRRWVAARLNPWGEQRVVLLSHLAPRLLPAPQRLCHQWAATDRFGFCEYPEVRAGEFRAARLAATRDHYAASLRALRVSALADRAYRELIADCRAAGVPVAFFVTPESPAFRSWYAPESRAEVDSFVRKLSEELGCPVFAAPADFAEDDFADGHHMLPHAAARFSRWLADTHLRPWAAEVAK